MQATDNSIYQRLPQAVICPAHADDVQLLARLLAEPAHRDVAVAARGGGTGTNGQSLTDGVVVDLSRNMNRILEIDVERRWVRVQAGVVTNLNNTRTQINALVSSSQSATGALQAAQSGNQLVALQTTQLADLTALMASIARAQSLDAARTLETQAQAQAQTNNFLNYGAGYQPGSAQMFH